MSATAKLTANDIIDRVYHNLISSTLTIDELIDAMVGALVRNGWQRSTATRIVNQYLDA